MGQKTKRIINAFLIGFSGTLLTLTLDHYQDFSRALADNNWVWLRNVGVAVVAGAFVAGLRAIQAYVAVVPSPEVDERSP